MRDLLIITPTRERRENVWRLIRAVADTCTAQTDLILAVDDDDRSYDDLGLLPDWVQITCGLRQDVAGWTNAIAVPQTGGYLALASIGDDHVPRTPGWDEKLLGALHGRPGVAYGNDLFQREQWPTAAVISAPVVAALGYMAPPGPEHLYIDCFWKRLGEDLGCLEYLEDVIIEHVHPAASKAAWDESYLRSNSIGQYSRDEAAYEAFLANRWPGDLKVLREKLDVDGRRGAVGRE